MTAVPKTVGEFGNRTENIELQIVQEFPERFCHRRTGFKTNDQQRFGTARPQVSE